MICSPQLNGGARIFFDALLLVPFHKLSLVALLFGSVLLSACVNQAGTRDPYHLFTITEEQRKTAKENDLPYVVNKRGNLRTIQPIVYKTEQFGIVTIEPGFVSDGSSRPFDNNLASIRASILHDAMYRGSPKLRFENGFPGSWTKAQADTVYCLQLMRLGAPERLASTNCRTVRFLRGQLSVWSFHSERRERNWAAQRQRPQ